MPTEVVHKAAAGTGDLVLEHGEPFSALKGESQRTAPLTVVGTHGRGGQYAGMLGFVFAGWTVQPRVPLTLGPLGSRTSAGAKSL